MTFVPLVAKAHWMRAIAQSAGAPASKTMKTINYYT